MTDPRTAPVRVLLVDDDALVRAGLRLMLGADAAVEVVGEVGDGADVLDAVTRTAPDVVLMDVRMPLLDGVAATAALSRLGERAPAVLVLTTFGADATVVAALRAGASGYLLKDTPPGDIVRAVHRVADGEPAFSPEVTRSLVALAVGRDGAGGGVAAGAAAGAGVTGEHGDDGGSEVARAHDEARERLAGLSEREVEVALAVAQGLSNAEIAGRLYLSTSSVKVHLSSALAKAGLSNRVQLAILTHEARLGSDEA